MYNLQKNTVFRQKKHQGFTLIELMIVMVIIAILSAIAIPSYQSYTRKARFTEIISAVVPFKLAVAMALQQGINRSEITNGNFSIPKNITPTKTISSIKVQNAIITAQGTELVNNASLILTPNADGSYFSVSGKCVKLHLCDQ